MERYDDIMKSKHCIASVGSLIIPGAVAVTGCLETNKDHCISKGGDTECVKRHTDEQTCTMSLGEERETSPDGCMREEQKGFAHVKFGLPRAMGMPDDTGYETVWALLEGCGVGEDDIKPIAKAYRRLQDEVLDDLDGSSRVRVRIDKDVIDQFNAEIDKALMVCGGGSTGITDGTSSTTSMSSSESSTASTASTFESSTSGGGCMGNEECLGTTPFCNVESGQCVPCSGMPIPDAACAEADPWMPRCVGDACVGCTEAEIGMCDQQLWACDFRTGGCFSCAEHHQCTSGACDIFMGRCFDSEMVIEVGGGDDRLSTIAEGLAELTGQGPDRLDTQRGVLLLHGDAGFDEVVDLEMMGGDVEAIALVAAPGERPTWAYTNGTPSATLATGAMTRTYLDGVALRGNTNLSVGHGLVCDGGRVDIRRSHIVNNGAGAIQALGTCRLHVENSFIGVDTDGQVALAVGGGATATILYSTLAAGEGTYAAALFCAESPSVEVRNSLLVARTITDEVQCDAAVLINSARETGGLGYTQVGWFLDYANGDYHLTNMAPLGIQAAIWQPGDPTTDIDGNPRDMLEGDLDHAGADVP